MRVDWSQDARNELADIYDYLSPLSEAAAVRTIRAVLRRGQQLEQFPESGRVLEGDFGRPLREVFSGPYGIIYAVSEASVEVIAVRHGRRLLDLS